MESVNCTVPFLPPDIRKGYNICANETLGKVASNILYTSPMRGMNLWSRDNDLIPPCIFYQFDIEERYNYRGSGGQLIRRIGLEGDLDYQNSNVEVLYLEFFSEMLVTEQFWAYEFMSYIAENGGFIGLFLGYSLLHLREILNGMIKRAKKVFK